ncbi:MAG: hypothetical protein JRH06_13990 [Deltaproteobacteria bacterium]|nr:hypothetical protein [Deltaproteobacteria bacterium]MBW2138651.1 hypothetical protein [Deltaproteobacteria bacterium]
MIKVLATADGLLKILHHVLKNLVLWARIPMCEAVSQFVIPRLDRGIQELTVNMSKFWIPDLIPLRRIRPE